MFCILLCDLDYPNSYWHKSFDVFINWGLDSVFTLSIQRPQLLTMLVLKFEKVNLLPDVVSKNCWMNGKQCRPWQDTAESGSTLFAQTCLSKYILLCLIWVYTVCSGLSVQIHMVNMVNLLDFLPFSTMETSFVPFCTPNPFWKGVYYRKEFASKGRADPFSEGR